MMMPKPHPDAVEIAPSHPTAFGERLYLDKLMSSTAH